MKSGCKHPLTPRKANIVLMLAFFRPARSQNVPQLRIPRSSASPSLDPDSDEWTLRLFADSWTGGDGDGYGFEVEIRHGLDRASADRTLTSS